MGSPHPSSNLRDSRGNLVCRALGKMGLSFSSWLSPTFASKIPSVSLSVDRRPTCLSVGLFCESRTQATGGPIRDESPLWGALWTMPPGPLPDAPLPAESPLRPPLGAQFFFALAARLQRGIASYLPGSPGPCCPRATRALPSRLHLSTIQHVFSSTFCGPSTGPAAGSNEHGASILVGSTAHGCEEHEQRGKGPTDTDRKET